MKPILYPILLGIFLFFSTNRLYSQLSYITGTPDGFASLNGGTIGGQGGTVVTVTNADELLANMDNNATLIILVQGTITISSELSCRGNKTLVGLGTDARIKGGGLAWNTKKNVIIQNIVFEGSGDDMLKINNKCENFWIDHCTIRDSETGITTGVDGGLDITRGTKNITVSYCHFYNHDKNMLIGHSDSEVQDTNICVTIHHCFFDGTIQRNPRVRFATVHCYNNYYLGNSTYGIASATNANVLVENCYFKNVPSPIIVGVPGFSPAGWLVQKGSIFENCGTPQTKEKAMDFTRYYSYTLDSANEVQNLVLTYSGSTKPYRTTTPTLLPKNVQSTKIVNLTILNNEIRFTSSKTCPIEIKILDITGKTLDIPFRGWVKENINNSITLNMNNLKAGTYICTLKASNQQIQQKFIVK